MVNSKVGGCWRANAQAHSACLDGDLPLSWRLAIGPLIVLGIGLLVRASAWVAFSAFVFHLFVPARIDTPMALLQYVVQQQGSVHFALWLLAGALGAARVFGATVVAVPLLLDRDIGLRAALVASVRACGENPLTLALWDIGLTWGIGAFIALMLVIIWKVAKESKAGRFGTFVLFFRVGVRHLRLLAETGDPMGDRPVNRLPARPLLSSPRGRL